MEIKLAKTAGFCFGVDRAVNLVYELLEKGERVCTLGPIIHNAQLVADLESKGVKIIEKPEFHRFAIFFTSHKRPIVFIFLF